MTKPASPPDLLEIQNDLDDAFSAVEKCSHLLTLLETDICEARISKHVASALILGIETLADKTVALGNVVSRVNDARRRLAAITPADA